jgi:hypothetical protein
MAITISGSGITSANIADGTIVNADVNDVAASKLTGALPAISGASLTGITTGKVLQVLSTTKTDTFSTSSASWQDVSGVSVTITPSSTTSKILVSVSGVLGTATTGAYGGLARLMRGGLSIGHGDSASGVESAIAGSYSTAHDDYPQDQIGFHYLDNPSTTSATTYKLQIKSGWSGYNFLLGFNGAEGSGNWAGRYATIITVMEIGA